MYDIHSILKNSPRELGTVVRALADKGINIIVQYSDHDNRLILVTDNDILAEKTMIEWAV